MGAEERRVQPTQSGPALPILSTCAYPQQWVNNSDGMFLLPMTEKTINAATFSVVIAEQENTDPSVLLARSCNGFPIHTLTVKA